MSWTGSRPAVGAQAVGIGQAALDAAVAYAKERQQFGQPIAAFQGIQFMLADMAIAVHGSRLLVHHAAALVDRGARRRPSNRRWRSASRPTAP